jgi:hypothetical protein
LLPLSASFLFFLALPLPFFHSCPQKEKEKKRKEALSSTFCGSFLTHLDPGV